MHAFCEIVQRFVLVLLLGQGILLLPGVRRPLSPALSGRPG